MPESCKCDLLRTTQELESFYSTWNVLWDEDVNATPFQTPQWLLPWWHQFGQPDLRTVVMYRTGKPIAFVPFYIYRAQGGNERQLLLLGVGTSDYLDGVFAPECTTGHIGMALDLLRKEGGWDVLYAGQLRPQSILFRALQESKDIRVRRFDGESCSRMEACRLAELPVKIRRNAMYYRNRAMRQGRLELTVADESTWSVFFDGLEHLHTARWQSRGQGGVLADRRVLAWHREAIPLLQKRGMLRLHSLRLDGDVLGVAYSLIDLAERPGRTEYIYLTAHSLRHAALRPGTLLLALMMEQAAEEGVETIDMLRGDEAYKKLWHVEAAPTFAFAMQHAGEERELLSA
ncbi:MAG: GNAT family N-acetyltransferase [Candidatus Sulfotelmatobacter sp.]